MTPQQNTVIFQRPLIPCLFCFLLGLWIMHAATQQDYWVAGVLLLLCLGGAALLSLLKRDSTFLFLGLVVLSGCFRLMPVELEHSDADTIAASFDTVPRLLQGTVVTHESLDSTRSYLVLSDVTMTSASELVLLPGRLKLSLSGFETTGTTTGSFVAGDHVQAFAAVREPRSLQNFFGRSTRDSLALKRVYYTASVKSASLIEVVRPANTWMSLIRAKLAAVRRQVEHTMTSSMPAHSARLMICMLFNDMRQLTDEDERIFRDSGTMHLFAVSGMHVAIFALILNMLFRACRCKPRLSWTLVIVVLFGYMVLLDFIAPAFRAFLMVLACTLGRILGREIDSISSLAFGAFLILIGDPLSPWQVGFQLSVMGVVAILLVAPLFRMWIQWPVESSEPSWTDKLNHFVFESVNITIAVTLVLLPLQLYYFHQLNLLSPLANLLEAALAAPVLGAAVAVIAAGWIHTGMAVIIGSAASGIMQLVYDIARSTADMDWAIVHMAEFPSLVVLLFYLVLFSGYYVTFRDTPEFRLKARARLAVHGCSCICLLVLTGWWKDSNRPLRIWFFDVGQGDSTLVQFPNGQNVLIDAGTNLPNMGRMVVIPQLKALGVGSVDYLVGSHPDTDHTGGIPDVIKRYNVRYYVEPDEDEGTTSDEITREIRQLCADKHIPEFQPSDGDVKQLGDECKLEILSPPRDENEREPLKDNNRSIVLRITYGKFSALLMADAETPIEQRLVERRIGPCTLLKVGHHGSRTSSIPTFVAMTKPKLAVISCGLENRFGHPSPDVLRRFEQVGSRVLRTDLDGATMVETDGESFAVSTAAGEHP